MSELPGARVVRGGRGKEGPASGAGVTPEVLVLQPAPRAVPRGLVRRQIFGPLGWLLAAFGMVLVLLLLPGIDLDFGSFDRQTTATITKIQGTFATETKRRVHRVHYTFLDEAGVERRGESYTTEEPERPGPWPVEYRSSDPSRSQLLGMRQRTFPSYYLLVFVFPIAGLALVGRRLVTALRDLRLLRHGAETRGKLVRKDSTGVSFNQMPVLELTFEYEVGGKTYSTTVKRLTPEPVEDNHPEPMLYDPRSPSRATTLDHLPGSVQVAIGGGLEARPGAVIHLLILPVVFVGLVAATVYRMI